MKKISLSWGPIVKVAAGICLLLSRFVSVLFVLFAAYVETEVRCSF